MCVCVCVCGWVGGGGGTSFIPQKKGWIGKIFCHVDWGLGFNGVI